MKPLQARNQEQPRLLPQPLNSVSYMRTCEYTHTQVHTQPLSPCLTKSIHTQQEGNSYHTPYVKNCNFLTKTYIRCLREASLFPVPFPILRYILMGHV